MESPVGAVLDTRDVLRVVYSCARVLRRVIEDHPNPVGPWPPSGVDLTCEKARGFVPMMIWNSLVWLNGMSNEVSEMRVNVDPDAKIMSLAQDDGVLVSSGTFMTPEHMALGMTLRHWTGSSRLMNLLHGLGHCSSLTTVKRHDTALAQYEIDSNDSIPTGFTKGKFTTLVWDNITTSARKHFLVEVRVT